MKIEDKLDSAARSIDAALVNCEELEREISKLKFHAFLRVVGLIALGAIMFYALSGCGKNHTVTVKKPESTTTITKTVKTTAPVPVVKQETVISTQTVTLDSKGKILPPAADLHKVEVTPPTPTKTQTPCDRATPEWVKAMHLKDDPNCKDGVCK